MTKPLDALRISAARLRSVITSLSEAQLVAPAYPADWTIAHVLSHLGSGAVILTRRLADAVAGRETAPDFSQSVWDSWNAKSPRAQAEHVLVADQALIDALDALSQEARESFHFSMGPMNFDFDGFVYLRLNEHVLHLWDVEVALDPSVTLTPDAVPLVVDNLELVVRFTAKSRAAEHLVHVRTTDPRRDLALAIGGEGVTIGPSAPVEVPDLVIPAEALIRLVYGRMDPVHTPATHGTADLDELRSTFPGV
jgi:uncharacterized protein (TIGR03083 family)